MAGLTEPPGFPAFHPREVQPRKERPSAGGLLVFHIIKTMAGYPVAKEVGMGNPAEENDRTPNRGKGNKAKARVVKDF
jgi:hypothetical protein